MPVIYWKKRGVQLISLYFNFVFCTLLFVFFVAFLFLQWVVSLDFCSNLSLSLMRIFVNFCFLYYNRYIYRPLFYVKIKMRRTVVYINKGIKFAFLFIDMLFLKVSNKNYESRQTLSCQLAFRLKAFFLPLN